MVWFSERVQQGDPMGSLLFCLAIHPILLSLSSPLRIAFMDDVTLGGEINDVARSRRGNSFNHMGGVIGLDLNHAKCELIPSHHLRDSLKIPFREAQLACPWRGINNRTLSIAGVDETCLLGAPLVCSPAMNRILEERCIELEQTIIGRLKLLASRDALLILRSAFGSSKMLNVLRSSPCVDHPSLVRLDSLLRSGLTSITNCALDDSAWLQSSLSIRDGGLGI